MISIEIRSIRRIIEYDLGYLQIEVHAFRNDVDTYIKRKNQEEYSFIKNIPSGMSSLMTVETLIQDILIQHALGNKVTEYIRVELNGVDYNHFTFCSIYNGTILNVDYSIGNQNHIKNRIYYANYFDINQILFISNELVKGYIIQREKIEKDKEKLIEKTKPKKKKFKI